MSIAQHNILVALSYARDGKTIDPREVKENLPHLKKLKCKYKNNRP